MKAADVARLAGVSPTTVSFVLNGRDEGNIAPATAERVRAAAAELGYTPDRVAQSLRLQRTHVLGLVTDAIASSPFAGGVLAGAVDCAAERGYLVVFFDSQGNPEREQQAVDELSRRRVDGLLYASMGRREVGELPRTRLPLVLANCVDLAGAHDAVVPDDTGGAREAASHLVALGHRRIAMVSGPGGDGGNMAGPLRESGFQGALARGGVPEGTVVTTGWTIDAGYAGAMRLLAGADGRALPVADRPSAIFAVTDRAATGVLLAAGRLGLRVPEDLSVVGFDDQEELAARVVPALTTLALPHRRMGEVAVQRLLARLGGRTPTASDSQARSHVESLPCPLVVRDSTARPTH